MNPNGLKLPLPVFLVVVLTLMLHTVGARLLGYHTWGFNVWAIAPFWLAVTASLVVLSSFLFTVNTIHFLPSKFSPRKAIKWEKVRFSQTWRWLALILLIVFVYLIRSRLLLYGDGFIAVSNTTLAWSESFRSIHELLKPLSIVLYKAVYGIAQVVGINPENSFAICSAVGGALGFLGLYRLVQAARVESELQYRRYLFAAACTSGAVLLFCGHMELYVWAGAAYLWFLGASYGFLKNGRLSTVLVWGLLTVAFNMMFLPSVAAVVLLLLRTQGSKLLSFLTPYRLLIAIGVVSIASATLLQWFGAEYGTVPLLAHDGNAYSLLSMDHLSDMLNAVIFAAPLSIAMLFGRGVASTSKQHWILLIGAVVPLLVAMWIDVDAGAARDWDLLSLFGIPLTLLAALNIAPRRQQFDLGRTTLSLGLLSLFLVVPQLYERIDVAVGVDKLNTIISGDPHYQPSYKNGLRNVSWSALLNDNFGRPDLAEVYARRRVTADPGNVDGLSNLALILHKQGNFDSAAVYFQRARKLDPSNDQLRSLLQQVFLSQSKYELAAELLPANAAGDSAQISFLRNCGAALLSEEKYSAAVNCYLRADSLGNGSWIDRFAIAVVYMRKGDKELTLSYLEQSRELCPLEFLCQFYKGAISSLVKFKHTDMAEIFLTQSKKVCGELFLDSTQPRIQEVK